MKQNTIRWIIFGSLIVTAVICMYLFRNEEIITGMTLKSLFG